jgi:hypothetical protein
MRRSLETFQRVLGPRIARLQPTGGGKTTATGEFQIAYWTAFRDRMIASQSPVKPQKPMAYTFANFAIGRSGFYLSASALTTRKEIAVYLFTTGPKAKSHFRLLAQDRAAVEAELGEPLEWREALTKKDSSVVLRRPGVDPTDRTDWPRQHGWLQERLEAFRRVFGPRVKALKAEPTVPDEPPPT